ncbi:unnamed protein product [Nesidiocoris tenuis]|uniref:Uncharacterized protein n=1 Tax=Nesidiocoris tenuis TaxID=355587 RepID=A0A6H5FX78_9HEMI|nr:unnamed protein product [Nesidiocoris tenuis]
MTWVKDDLRSYAHVTGVITNIRVWPVIPLAERNHYLFHANLEAHLPPQTPIRVLHQCGSCPKTCAKILIPISSTGSTNGVAFWSANHTDVFSTNEARLE